MEGSNCSCHKELDRKNLGIKVDQDELNSIILVNTKISCARQAATPAAIPDGVDEKHVRLYVKGALDALAEAQFLASTWWKSMQHKHQLPTDRHIHIDFQSGEFYEVVTKASE